MLRNGRGALRFRGFALHMDESVAAAWRRTGLTMLGLVWCVPLLRRASIQFESSGPCPGAGIRFQALQSARAIAQTGVSLLL